MSALMPISCWEQPINAVASGRVIRSVEGVAGTVGAAVSTELHDEPNANPTAGGNGGGVVAVTGGCAAGALGAGEWSAAFWLKA